MKKIILSAAAVFSAYAAFENLFMLTVRRECLRKDGIRVVQVSDLHKKSFGRDNHRLCERVRRESPDIILITGDLVTRDSESYETAYKTLKTLCGMAPVYMIYGNHEQSIPDERKAEFEEMLSKTDVILLKNSFSDITLGERKVRIYGLCEPYSTYKKNGSYRGLDTFESTDMERLIGKRPDGEVWLMAHNPLHCEAYSEWGADLTFSGHVHGGAVRMFGIGILSPERRFFPKYSKGIYSEGKMKLLVSAGLGKLRLFDPPEIVVYLI